MNDEERARKGFFPTPQIWVELSQQYIADVLGEDWQDEYYIWDCAAGTGNLLAGLTNKYNIWASTIDKADVDVMHDRIANGANLLEDHCFQFDFLNDSFDKLPKALQAIINHPEKRKKLVIYINPPYAEATSARTVRGTGENKPGVAILHKTRSRHKDFLGKASNEILSHFLARAYCEIPSCIIAHFAKIGFLQSGNFTVFRQNFQARLKKPFLVPATSFDNVSGQFPIGFFIWDTSDKTTFKRINADVYDKEGYYLGKKKIYAHDKVLSINQWIRMFIDDKNENGGIGYLPSPAPDFQNNNYLFISKDIGTRHVYYLPITNRNLVPVCIYFAVRKVIPADWLNDRDQFLYPNDGWKTDREFRNDCLAYTLFHGSNNIQSTCDANHWIPFTAEEVGAKGNFESNFMTDFIAGKMERSNNDLFTNGYKSKKLVFSKEAKAVFNAGRKLWIYYHLQPYCNANASLYDIREHFQGRNAKTGRMNNSSNDETYNELIAELRLAMKTLAAKIEPKVYEYGFLKK